MEQQGWAAPDSEHGSEGPAAGHGGFVTPPDARADDGVPARRPDPSDGDATRRPANVPPARLPAPLRPMTLSDLLDGAFAVIKSRPRTVFTIAAVILIPVHVISAFLQRDFATSLSISNSVANFGTESGGVSDSAIFGSYLGAALVALSLFFLGGAIGRLVTAWYAGGDLTAREALAASFRRTPALVAAFLVLLPLKLLGACGLYIGLIVPVALFSLTAPVIVVERVGPIAGARRSWRLIARRFWYCVGVVLLAVIGSSILTTVLGGVPGALAALLPAPLDWIASAAVSAGVAMIVTTAVVSMSVLLYLDLRIRTEGLDLELLATDAFAGAR